LNESKIGVGWSTSLGDLVDFIQFLRIKTTLAPLIQAVALKLAPFDPGPFNPALAVSATVVGQDPKRIGQARHDQIPVVVGVP
jgi:hypothetical protein